MERETSFCKKRSKTLHMLGFYPLHLYSGAGGTQGTQEARLGSEIKVCQNICVFFSESGATRHLARGLEG